MHATDIQCVALTGFAAVDEPDAVGLLVGPAVAHQVEHAPPGLPERGELPVIRR